MTNNAFSHEPTTQKIEDTRHKQINLLRPSAYIIFADMKETSALIDKACRNLNIDSLNGMQKQMFETAMRPNDIILLSPTGSGKTLAFLLPVLSRIYPKIAGVQALVIVPSRELALQIDNVLRKIAAGIKIVCCYGGHSVREESKSLAVAPALIVGTPGRIADHIRRGRIVLETLDTLVLDEFDKSLALGFQDEMQEIIAPLKNVKKKILTSATDSESLPAFTALKKPVKLNFLGSRKDSETTPTDRLSLYRIDSPIKDKLETLLALLHNLKPGLTLIFCNQRESVDRVRPVPHRPGHYRRSLPRRHGTSRPREGALQIPQPQQLHLHLYRSGRTGTRHSRSQIHRTLPPARRLRKFHAPQRTHRPHACRRRSIYHSRPHRTNARIRNRGDRLPNRPESRLPANSANGHIPFRSRKKRKNKQRRHRGIPHSERKTRSRRDRAHRD